MKEESISALSRMNIKSEGDEWWDENVIKVFKYEN